MARSQGHTFVLLLLVALPAAWCQIDIASFVSQATNMANIYTQQANSYAAQAVNQANALTAQAINQANDAVARAQAMARDALAQALKPHTVGGVGSGTCGDLAVTSGDSCANGHCCSVAQRVRACNGKMEASTTINGKYSMCCVALINKKTGKPKQFCAADHNSDKYARLPSSAIVTMQPSCNSWAGSGSGQLLCTVKFGAIPSGFAVPSQTSWNNAYRPGVGAGFAPCGNGAYKVFKQVKKSWNTIQSQCA